MVQAKWTRTYLQCLSRVCFPEPQAASFGATEEKEGYTDWIVGGIRALSRTEYYLRKLSTELVTRRRCLYSFECVRSLQKIHTSTRRNEPLAAGCSCAKCGETNLSQDDVLVRHDVATLFAISIWYLNIDKDCQEMRRTRLTR